MCTECKTVYNSLYALTHNLMKAEMSKYLTTKNNVSQSERARIIKRTLGVKVAAKYLKKRGWSIDAALFIILGK